MAHPHHMPLDYIILEITNIAYSYDCSVKLTNQALNINREVQRKKHDNYHAYIHLFAAV